MTASSARPWLDVTLPIHRRAELLVAAMSIDECAAQLDQLRIDEITEDDVREGVGSAILATSATAGNDAQPASSAPQLDALQRVAVERSRLGIPLVFARDVIHGHHTIFPIPLGQAASWDAELVEASCRAAAVEASADGIRWTFAPMLDVCRDPRWGRVAESYGESAHLTGALGVAAVHGFQTADLAAPDAIAACAKHFAGYSAAEGGRDHNTAEISRPTLEDVYLPPFHAATLAGCASVMAAFNTVDGLPAGSNRALLTGVLRERWGFDGLVVTDWNAVAETRDHGTAADTADAAAQCLLAGSDVDMVSRLFRAELPGLVARGRVAERAVREAAARVLRFKLRLGLFERPFTGERPCVQRAPHRALARRCVARGAVLLANAHETLPLAAEHNRLALVGPLADAKAELFGTWVLDGIVSEVASLAQALERAGRAVTTGATSWADDAKPAQFDGASATSAADGADAIIVVVGERPDRSGEANSVVDPSLPAGQPELLEHVLELARARAQRPPRLVLVVIAGRPLVLPACADAFGAVLWSFHPGSEGGLGLADVLLGAAEPGGRLPITIPRHGGQIPIFHDHTPTGRPLGEYHRQPGAHGGRRYLDCAGAPKWRFGEGHGYTAFALREARVLSAHAEAGVRLSCTVANAGVRAGETVVQVYVADPVAELSQPVRRLVAFMRVSLDAGASRELQIGVEARALAYCHRDGARRVDAGQYVAWIGFHSSDGAPIEFEMVDARVRV